MSPLRIRLTLAAGLAGILLAILDQTIVASAAAPVVRDLRASETDVPWLVAAYVIASTCVQPLYGKLADRYGPRPIFLLTLGLFMAGSALCAAASSAGELIAFRAVQGLGGGGLMSVTLAALSHLRYAGDDQRRAGGEDPASSGNLMGATLVGIGIVLGPTIGGQIVAHLSWRWIFLINLPLGGAAFAVAWIGMRLPDHRRPGPLEPRSAALLAVLAACLLLVCQWGGGQYAWGSWQIIGLALLGLIALLGFLARQAVAAEPLFPVRILALRDVRVIAAIQLLTGMGMTGGTVYLTIELQLVHGISPQATGLRLLPMALGLALGSLLGRRLLTQPQTLMRAIALGATLSALAFGTLALAGTDTEYWQLALLLCLLGSGIGVGLGTEMIVLQRIVEPSDIGIATAGVRFIESLGGSVAAAGLAALFAHRLHATATISSAVAPVFGVCALTMLAATLLACTLPLRDLAAGQHQPRGVSG